MTRRPVGSVARALALLEELRDSDAGLGVNELARRIAVNPSTASRLLATLEASGFVQRDRSGGPYRLGPALVALADGVDLEVAARLSPVALTERPSVAHSTAAGKVMLAFGGGRLPREAALIALTPRTITDRAELASQIRAVRERGYATALGERDLHLNEIAVPAFGRDGQLAAVLVVQAPAARLPDPTVALEVLLEAAARLAASL